MLQAKAATSDPSLFPRGVGVYCRGLGICRRQIQLINVSAIIPSDPFWGFIVREAMSGKLCWSVCPCSARPEYLSKLSHEVSLIHEFIHNEHVLSFSGHVLRFSGPKPMGDVRATMRPPLVYRPLNERYCKCKLAKGAWTIKV